MQNYGKFYVHLLDLPLSTKAIKTYIYLSSFARRQVINPSLSTIGKSVGILEITHISKAVKELEKAKLIGVQHTKREDGLNYSNQYTIYKFLNEKNFELPFGLVDITLLPLLTKQELKIFILLSQQSRLAKKIDFELYRTILKYKNKQSFKRSISALVTKGIILLYETEKGTHCIIKKKYTSIKDKKELYEFT